MPSCPISQERINERVARLVGWCILFFALSYLLKPSLVWLLFLLVDFTARSFYRPLSPLAQLCQPIAKHLGRPIIVDAAPKIFAARIGLAMSLGASILALAHQIQAAQAIIAIMALCALLEGAFGYCVGCKFYTLWHKIGG